MRNQNVIQNFTHSLTHLHIAYVTPYHPSVIEKVYYVYANVVHYIPIVQGVVNKKLTYLFLVQAKCSFH